jgi:hypothetical protein
VKKAAVVVLAIVVIIIYAAFREMNTGQGVASMSVSAPVATRQAQEADRAALNARAEADAYATLVLKKQAMNLLPAVAGFVVVGIVAGVGIAEVRRRLKRGNVHPANDAGQYGIQEVRTGDVTEYRNLDAMVQPSTTFKQGRVGQLEPSSPQAEADVRIGLLLQKTVTAASRSGEMVRRQELHARLAERLGWGRPQPQPTGPNDIAVLSDAEAETHLLNSGILQPGGNNGHESGTTYQGPA